ncbi:5-formyltetrahydrofolate cyclo-ligase [Microlunatus capsulatus]|uniref:5-formyltetrahydrofolate cyclo-ligase n=1 Tax=Microlunatus capsulatus TaxID=99117 RepID=A0ABS4ZAG1_9ACTN|nr:5-formyltetrahydrofolate cyclo-ligase [Microlunatus capsulatus]MBP2418043.1 5-formyltetrahydrofolate cyclo-ligase [Microlunatus capsulatus]
MPPTTADDAALARAKDVLRQAVQLRRESRSAEQRTADDEARLAVLDAALGATLPRTVAAYLSTGAEPGTLQLVGWLAAHGVEVLLPVLSRGRAPAWAPYAGPDALRPGRHGILEPAGEPLPDDGLRAAELVLCPGLAANRRGDRLGRGGGWYDRALAAADPAAPVWVLLNADEVFDAVPAQAWDVPVDGLVTPQGLLPCAR